jgi:AGZA family xanthine/uracil permease-like MFS transporter
MAMSSAEDSEKELEILGPNTDSEKPRCRPIVDGVCPYTNPIAISVDRYFEISKRGSTIGQEIIAGATTFLSMAYILTVNPNTLTLDPNGAMRWPSVFIATAIGSFVGTMLMAFLANVPLAQAPGMGLNSAVGALYAFGGEWTFENAMALCLIYSLIVMVVSIVPIGKDAAGAWVTLREKLFYGIPACVRSSIPVGIGLFIALIGFEDSDMVIASPYVLVDFVDLTKLWSGPADSAMRQMAKSTVVCLVSLFAITGMAHHNVRGSVVIGMLIGTCVAIPLGVADTAIIAGDGHVTWEFWTNFKNYFAWDGDRGGLFFCAFRGFGFPSGSTMHVIMNIITLGIVDLFDTMGTVVGCTANTELQDDNGKPLAYGRVMVADAIAAISASLLGTSSVTTYVESGTGITAGGKTGLVAVAVAVCFALSLFFLPLFAFIPIAASGAALIYVGVLMMGSVKEIDFTEVHDAFPAFMTITMMPFTYSITKGIGLGLLSYVVLLLLDWAVDLIVWYFRSRSDPDRPLPKWPIGLITGVIAILFCVYFMVPVAD